jgi:hypothetical protein
VTWPVVEAAYYSFFNWNGYGAPSKWIGLENFLRVLNDPIFYHSLFNNLLIVLVSAFIQVPMAQALHKELCQKAGVAYLARARKILQPPPQAGECLHDIFAQDAHHEQSGVKVQGPFVGP